ncbi:Asp-tRNA(Asn)/Glu-tRNA(Gln) amidotransferase subunit GatC [Actinomyces minihominis]|uniref:Asp-tRNA(Asn)/Glu-tRNA(Gln) amidotransferase subunit GatC n=1 Tax=Actinomyces minihominis TaxID=2002838 RepID=UPI000C06FEA2|nr:Asp-tRNA(Asn)/Glu-tRNA(Gln) amidotransferase subunit GatC [Actinomyces minihominis]
MANTTVTKDEVAELADLACIALSEAEISQLAEDLTAIAEAIDSVAAAVEGDTPQTGLPIPLTNVMRPDVIGGTIDREVLLAQAPAASEGMFEVPRILEED